MVKPYEHNDAPPNYENVGEALTQSSFVDVISDTRPITEAQQDAVDYSAAHDEIPVDLFDGDKNSGIIDDFWINTPAHLDSNHVADEGDGPADQPKQRLGDDEVSKAKVADAGETVAIEGQGAETQDNTNASGFGSGSGHPYESATTFDDPDDHEEQSNSPENDNVDKRPSDPSPAEIRNASQVHHRIDGSIILNEHPDTGVQAEIDRQCEEDLDPCVAALHEFLDITDNLNGQYAEEIEVAREAYVALGFEMPPVYILEQDKFIEAHDIVRPEGDPSRITANFTANRIILREYFDPAGQAMMGGDYILGQLLHEGGHATAGPQQVVAVTREFPIAEFPQFESSGVDSVRLVAVNSQSGFEGLVMGDDGNKKVTGTFWEEATADLLRVRELEKKGRIPDFMGKESNDGLVRFVDNEYIPDPAEDAECGLVTLPINFAFFAKELENGAMLTLPGAPGFAAYGLRLLTDHLPGLYDKILTSRRSPEVREEVISAINSVKPGLYEENAELSYAGADFTTGLRNIQHALAGLHT